MRRTTYKFKKGNKVRFAYNFSATRASQSLHTVRGVGTVVGRAKLSEGNRYTVEQRTGQCTYVFEHEMKEVKP